MQRVLFLIALTILFTGSLCAQRPGVTQTPDDAAVVKISTDLIQLDVTVTDRNGKVVTGLGPSDFEIFENGEKQTISSFSFISRASGGAEITAQDNKAAEPDQSGTIPRPITSVGQVRRTIAVIVDDLNLSFLSVHQARKALKKFVDEQMEPGDLVAIIRTGGGIGALQQFTSDKQMLHAAIEKIRWNALGGSFDSLASVGQNDTDITDRFVRESTLAATGSSKTTTIVLERDLLGQKKQDDYDASKNSGKQEDGIYIQSSLGAVRYIIEGMSKRPGRKAVMLFSDGLDISTKSNKSRSSTVKSILEDIASDANRSSVVVYTFDTKGMRPMSIQASDSTYEIIDGHRGQKENSRRLEFNDSQDGLAYLAHQTGGKALLNSDDFTGGIQRALDEQTGYYLLAYVPDSETFDADKRRFNKFEVKVNRPDLDVSYRSGFFNTGPEAVSKQGISLEKQMVEALMSPFAKSDIAVNVNALYANDPSDGAYLRSFLHIDAKGLTFKDAKGGWKTATFDVAALISAESGIAADSKTSEYTIRTKGATYETMLRNGFVYLLTMPVKKPGVYQYRVALRDAGSGKIGSAAQVIEVPDLSKHRLTISSIAVEGVGPSVWQQMQAGKVGTAPGQAHVASTLMYDTVLKQFVQGTVLRYGYEIYNLKLDPARHPQIETQARVLHNGAAVIDLKPTRLNTNSVQGRTYTKISGAVQLSDGLPVGEYVLQVVVNDLVAKRQSVQLFPFELFGK